MRQAQELQAEVERAKYAVTEAIPVGKSLMRAGDSNSQARALLDLP